MINVQYDTIEVDEYKEAQDEETSEPYYSEIIHNEMHNEIQCMLQYIVSVNSH